MAKWTHAGRIFSAEESEAFDRLLSPIVERLEGRISLDELREYNVTEACDIWFCWDDDKTTFRSVMITRVKHYKAGAKVLILSHAAGNLDDFDDMNMQRVESLARHYGCTKLQIDGRVGWGRALGPEWKEFSRSIEKEVGDGRDRRNG